jgi:hypothetical protein
MRRFGPKIYLAISALILAGGAAYAQAPGGDSLTLAVQPLQLPVVTALYTGSPKGAITDSQVEFSDQRALAGAQDLSPNGSQPRRSYWQPFFNLTSSLDTNPLGAQNTVSLAPWASFYGGADLHLASHLSDLGLSYLGGGVLSKYQNEDAPLQHLALSERLSWRHAVISLFDQLGYFPLAVSESYLPTDVGLLSARELSLQPVFLPNQSIAGTVGQQVTNSFLGELEVSPTSRSSLTFLESYSVVRFFNTGLLDLNDSIFQAGWDHQLTRNNKIAVLYRFTAFRFSSLYQPMDGHVVQLSFGRQVTGRLAFQLSAGPEMGLFRTLAGQGSSGNASPTVTAFKQLYWTVDNSMTYQLGRTVVKLGYDHGVTDGAGYLGGAVTDQGYGSIDEQLSRTFGGQVTGGYARNRGLITSIGTAQQPTNEIYQDWFGGVTVSHLVSRRASIFLSYQLQRQATNFACAGIGCGTNFTRHVISLGLTGRSQARPIG